MSSGLEIAPWKKLGELAEQGLAEQLTEEVAYLGLRESARAISRLSIQVQNQVLKLLDPEIAADLIEEISQAQAVELLKNLPAEDAGPILSQMDSNEAADILSRFDADDAEDVLTAMEPEAASDARRLSQYDAHVAGGLMITEYLYFPDTMTVGDVIENLRTNREKYSGYSVQYAYVVDREGKLTGVLLLRDLLMRPGDEPVTKTMIANPIAVHDDTPLVELEEFFEGCEFLAVPVVDSANRLLGVIRRADAEEAVGERADSAYLKSQGIVGGEELRSMPAFRRSRKRLSWLTANIGLNIMAASVIAFYQDTLTQVIALTVFLPIISDMSGCSGSQAVAVSIRELTLGLVKPSDFFHVLRKEVSVGLMNALVLGGIIAAGAWLWKGNPYLGIVVGGGLAANVVVAVSIGGLIPLALKKLKFDPALASGPLLTTVTDMCGFFFVLSLATLLLPQLT